ncbi:MAG: 6-bladed beta-propeller [Bacteroidales bacterium]|nr:6-bladed beta-propeller [Bacteroidales bacterium]
MKTYLILTFYFLLLLSACSQTQKSASIDEVIPINLHESVNPPSSAEEWINEITFIPLETNEDCFLASRTKYDMSENHIVASSNNTVHIFDRQGNHINSFKREGKGPGEYVRIYEIRLMPETEELMISDPNGRKILVYDFNGKTTIEIPVKFMMMDVVPVSSTEFACYMGRMNRAYVQDSSLFEMVIINSKGEKIEQYKPFKYAFPSGVTATDFTGPANPGEYYINLAYAYDIYQVGPENHFEKKYSFDYLDHSIDTTKLSDESFMKSSDADSNLDGFCDLDHLVVNANTILFWAPNIDSKEWGYRMINRKTGNQKSIFWNKNQNIGEYHGIPISFGPNASGEYFYHRKDAIDMLETIEALTEVQKDALSKSKGFNKLKNLKEDDNPVLVLYKVKDF